MTFPPLRKITDVFSRRELTAIYRHLHGGNAPTDYIIGTRDQGQAQLRKARQFEVDPIITWAINTIAGKAAKPATFVPFCKDPDNFSTHGVMDFDEHDGDGERAKRWAIAAFEALKIAASEMCLMLVRTGKGWHVWAIAHKRLPCSYWVGLLETIVTDAGMELKPGSCEVFPSTNFASQQFGKGVRAPGSYNPKYDQVDEVAIHNAKPLVASLLGSDKATTTATFPKRERSTIQSTNNIKTDKRRKEEENESTEDTGEQPVQDSTTTSPSDEESDNSVCPDTDDYDDARKLYRGWNKRWARKFKIIDERTRHNLLASLTGEMFPQVGYRMGRRIAAQQYAKKTAPTKASLEEHLTDFDQLWNGLQGFWYGRLSPEEVTRFDELKSTAQKDAFRIIHSYNRLAKQEGRNEFFIARDDLASRLGVTPQYAGLIRFNFQESGIIRLTTRYQPHKTANRYSWGLSSVHAPKPLETAAATEAIRPPLAAPELQIWKLLIRHPTTYNGICRVVVANLGNERVRTAFKRLEDAMCIHKNAPDTYTGGPKPQDSDLRTILEYLVFKTKRDVHIDPAGEALLAQEVSRWVPGATQHDVHRALDVALQCEILTPSGHKGAWFDLGTRLGRDDDTKRRQEAIAASKPMEYARSADPVLESLS